MRNGYYKWENKAVREKETEVLQLVLEVTIVTGRYGKQHKSGMMFDKGSKCNIISEDLVARLKLKPLSGKIVTKSFRNEEEINIGFVVVELLKDDGTIARVRAYVLDSITEAQKVEIPEDIKKEFSKTDRWPKERYPNGGERPRHSATEFGNQGRLRNLQISTIGHDNPQWKK